ncbi:MAG: YggS family pyridoxal phosphate-dependent enzyme [Bdellovibrio sp.]|nr:MAG: YggS family pyridoxal phosphate-dependent enzyme [Bdellovibrio sp.]
MCLSERIERIYETIKIAAQKVKRDPSEIKVLAVSKLQPLETIKEANQQFGIKDFGENYLQEALLKMEALQGENLSWHFIGRIQKKKARALAKSGFKLIHSIDDITVLQKISQVVEEEGLPLQSVLVQVNLSEEPTKAGVLPREMDSFLEKTRDLKGVQLEGLMTLPPPVEFSEQARPFFQQLKQLRDDLEKKWALRLPQLSMGTSQDFDVAIEEGATIVRLGQALLGPRVKKK